MKGYAYRYAGSRLASQHPISEERMFALMGAAGVDPDKFEVFELVPVHVKTETVTTTTRTLVRK